MKDITFQLSNTRALVTGGSSGLGPAIVRALDAAGARVAIHYHSNRESAEQLAAELAGSHSLIGADLGQPGAASTLFAEAADALGDVNLLVNCAAVASQSMATLEDMSADHWREVQQANVDAPMLLTQAFAAQQKPGVVVNISSIEATTPAAGHGHYSVSKAALEMLTRSAALEFGARGIRVNAVAPGLIWRDGIDTGWPEGVAAWKAAAPLEKLVDPSNLADTVLFLASDSAASMTGSVVTVDCGLSVRSAW